MKKLVLSLLMTLLAFPALADQVYDFTTNTGSWMPSGSNSAEVEKTAPDGQKFKFGKDAYFHTSGYLFIKQSGYISASLPNKCTKIILHTNKGSLAGNCYISIKVGTKEICTGQLVSTQNTDYTYDIPSGYQSAGNEYQILNSSSQKKNAQITKITFPVKL